MLASLIWSLTYAFYWLSSTAQDRIFWLDATYVGVVIAPGAFFVFKLVYTHRERWINRATLGLLTIEPVITLILLWTDPLHGVFFDGKRTPDSSTIFDGGPWFWTHVVYSYGILMVSYVLLVQLYRRTEPPYRQQTRAVLFAVTLPWISNIISIVGLNPLPALDLTPVAFTVTGLILTYALFYNQLFDLMPVARDKVIETMREPVFVVDAQRRIIDLNPAARRLLHEMMPKPADSFIGQPITVFFSDWTRWITEGDTRTETRLEIAGKERYYERLISPLIDPHGQQQGKVVVLNNITRRKLEQQRELEIRLEKERRHLLSTFIQNASHEFRTPLTVINSSAHLMARLDDPAKRAAKVEQIQQEARRITRLVDMLLLMSQLESQEALTCGPVDLNAVADAASSELNTARGETPVIRCEQQASLPPVMGEQDYLIDAVGQLLDNARRFTPPDGTITLATGADNGHVWIEVRDTGPGISEKMLSTIFETFWREDVAHSTPGFGLGLSISKKIIEMHGGTLEVHSVPRQGSTFRALLPAAPER
jgi:signal transduction histidine kinase